MLYNLNDNVFNLNKLEMVSKIIFFYGDKNKAYFRYSVNGYTWDSKLFITFEEAKLERNNLIKAWMEVKGDNL